ncbi:putative ribonuclease H-like domain-containing protein [Tanacetum coccineum]
MEAGSSTMVTAAKLPVLNLREFELWKMRIEQYFLMTDYALWEVIVNGDSPPPKRTVDGVEQTYPPTTAEEKLARKNELKARGTLLMALPNEHQLKFNTYKCAKTLMEAIEKRFGGNKESKKTQKTLLKQQYENFNGSSSEGLDQTYDKLQKLISQLEILGETISQEDMNMKFLRSLPSEWKTHTLIWRNKPDLDTLSMDDLYNNLKIYETEVKGSSRSNQNLQNVAFVSSNNSGSSNQAYGSNSTNTDNMSDVIDADDLEEMDLKWQMAMLTMRARRFLNKTRRKINANGSETIGFNKSKVKCYNCHKKGHFTRECRAPRENMDREPIRRNVTVETTETNTLVAQDRLGYDWSDHDEEGPTNLALMAYISSGSSSSSSSNFEVSTCSKACAYKAGLESVEARLDVYKKNEIQVSDKFKTGVGFDSQVFDSQENDRYKTSKGYHESPSLILGNFHASKSDFDWISDSEDENETEFKSKQRKPSFAKIEFVKSNKHVKTPRESVKKDLNEIGIKTLNTARQNFSKAAVSVNTARPINTAYPRPIVNSARTASNVLNRAHSHVRRPFNNSTTNKNSNLKEKVNTVKGNVTTVGPKAVVSDNKGNEANAVKASACWVWRPKQKVLDHVSRHNGASMNFKRFDYVDAQGRSKSVMAWVPKRA